MKKTIRLTESELTRLVKRIVNENMYDNTLYSDIMSVIRSSNSSHEETVDILKSIVDEMESSRRVRRGAEMRFRDNMNEDFEEMSFEENEPKKLSFEDWADVWLSLRKQYGETFIHPLFTFNNEVYQVFTGMNLDFIPKNDGEYLEVLDEYRNPRNWSDDIEKGYEILDRVENRLRDRIENSDAGLRFDTNDKYRFRIYKI